MLKIPSHAEKKFSGILFDIVQWEQELYDGSKATFEALRRHDAVMVLAVTEDGKILVTDEFQPPTLDFFGVIAGSVDKDEEPLEGAKRELLEESGYVSDDWEHWRTYNSFHHMEWNLHTFIARGCVKKQEQNLDPGEKITINELSFEEFLKLMKNRKFRNDILALDILRMTDEEIEALKEKLFLKRTQTNK